MGISNTNAGKTELAALLCSAAPFVGFGVTAVTELSFAFIIGMSMFLAWMLLASVLFTRDSMVHESNNPDVSSENTSEA